LLACAAALAACTASGAADGTVGLSATVEPPAATTEDDADAASTATPEAAEASTTAAPSVSPSEAAASSEPRPANAEVLDVTARRLDGGTMDVAQLAGGDVVLWMWAPWCPQCNREAPHVADVLAAHGDDVTLVGVAGHDSDDAHRAFVAEHGLEDMVTLVDDDGSLWARYGIDYQPAWVFIDEDGGTQVVAGGLYEDLDARVRALVDG